MKKRLFFAASLLSSLLVTADDGYLNKSSCTYKGYKLYGKVQFVESFPDLKVQVVTSFPDLKVQMVESFADSCGEWQAVESFPDVKLQIVTSFPDLKIQYVQSFPGMP